MIPVGGDRRQAVLAALLVLMADPALTKSSRDDAREGGIAKERSSKYIITKAHESADATGAQDEGPYKTSMTWSGKLH
ncbi:MAG: hypothetical protein R2724_05015 [Bryobacterales bacterium]